MKALEEKILKEGSHIGVDIIKVDNFINHQIDTAFLEEMGKEFGRIFADAGVTKILTVEASGIAIACAAAKYFNYVPVVFAKKTQPSTMIEDSYTCDCKSFTKGTVSTLRVSKKFLNAEDKILIIDDFLAHGEAAAALAEICKQAGAEVVGISAAIEKEYQGGSARLRELGYRVQSLAVIKEMKEDVIRF